MKIAICTDQYLPLLSGLVDSVETLAHGLREKGHEVRIYAPEMSGSKPDPNVFHFPLLFAIGSSLFFSLPFGAMRDMRQFKPDIVHTELFGMAGFLAWYAARRLHVPLVGTDHTFPADYLHYVKLDFPPFPYLIKKYAAWYYGRCDLVTTPSKKMLDELRAYGFRRPARVISNPIDPMFRHLENKSELKAKFGIEARAVAIFGRIAPEKNLDAAMDVFARVAARTEAQLVFIGDGIYRATLEKKAFSLGLAARVKFLGVLRGQELVGALNACDVLLITSTSENQPMTLLQAAACCLPIVAANAGGLPEYVHHDATGYVIEPTHIDEFARRVVELLEDEPRRTRYGANACALAEPWFPASVTKEFEKVYASL